MIFSLIFGLIFGGLTVIFALQNVTPITVTFLAWQIEGSLALVLLAAALMGAVICALLSIPEIIRDRIKFSALKNQNKELQNIVESQKTKIAEIEGRLSVGQDKSSVIF